MENIFRITPIINKQNFYQNIHKDLVESFETLGTIFKKVFYFNIQNQ